MTQFYLIVFLLLFLILALTLVMKRVGRRSGAVEFPFTSCETICTPAERAFLGVLELALPEGYRVFAKVRLADLVKVRGGLKPSARQAAFNRISRKHVDFVLCRADGLSIVGAVELDDGSHARSDRLDRDLFLDKALEAAGIPLMRFRAGHSYTVEALKQEIGKALGTDTAAAVPEPSREPADLLEETRRPDFGRCEKCGSPMVKRTVKKGPHAGKPILACSVFPKCRNIRTHESQEAKLSSNAEPHRAEMKMP